MAINENEVLILMADYAELVYDVLVSFGNRVHALECEVRKIGPNPESRKRLQEASELKSKLAAIRKAVQ
jgi:hypothetical protein